MPGYLSLHQTAQSLTIKWTPNQLMNGYTETDVIDKRFVPLFIAANFRFLCILFAALIGRTR